MPVASGLPKASCLNVSSHLIGGDCTLCRQLFPSQWLQQWLHRDTMTHFSPQACCKVSYFIVANYGNPPVELRACSTLSGFTHRQCEGSYFNEWHSYARLSHGPVLVGLLTRKRHLYWGKVQDTVDGKEMAVGIDYRPLVHFASSWCPLGPWT